MDFRTCLESNKNILMDGALGERLKREYGLELDGSLDLKCSEPEDFSDDMIKLSRIGAFQIWCGCCGTDKSKCL